MATVTAAAEPPGGVEVMVLSASMFQQLFRQHAMDGSVIEEVRLVHKERKARNVAQLEAQSPETAPGAASLLQLPQQPLVAPGAASVDLLLLQPTIANAAMRVAAVKRVFIVNSC